MFMSVKEHWKNVAQNAKRDLDAVVPSFTSAYQNGHYRELGIKATGVAVGAVLAGQGVSQLVKGATERVAGTNDPSKEQPNYTRMFVGAFSMFAGASVLYLAATKGVLPARSV